MTEDQAPSGGRSHAELPSSGQMTSLTSILRRKPLDAHRRQAQMPRVLGIHHLVSMGMGATIGAGVYVLVGTAARERAGPALTLSFLIAGIAAALAALCYAEMASRLPSAGSAYHYAYTCIGEVWAWMIGWGLVLEYTVGAAAVARGISPNLVVFFGSSDLEPWFLHRISFFSSGIHLDPVAAVLVAAATALLCVGIKESVTVQGAMVVINVLVLSFIIMVGAVVGFMSEWPGYEAPGGYFPKGLNGVLGGAAMVFFAYIGFDAVASTAEEVKRPQRDLPLGIGLSLAACGGLYMSVAAVLVGLVPYDQIDVDTPISSAFVHHGIHWASYVVATGATAALSTTLLGTLLPQPRVLMAMARDGLLPRWFSRLTVSRGTPANATLCAGALAAVMSFSMSIDQLSGMVSVGTFLAFTTVSVCVLILRYMPPPLAPPPDDSAHGAPLIPAPADPTAHVLLPQSDTHSGHSRPASPSTAASSPHGRTRPGYATVASGGDWEGEAGGSSRPSSLSPPRRRGGARSQDSTHEDDADLSGGERARLVHHGSRGGSLGGGEARIMHGSGSEADGEERRRKAERGGELDGVVELEDGPLLKKGRQQNGEHGGGVRVEWGVMQDGEPGSWPASKDEMRRQLAWWAILAIVVGAPVMLLGPSADGMPAWFRWTVGLLGLPPFVGGLVVLLFIEQHPGGASISADGGGGFLCPLVPWLPWASIGVNVYLMMNLGVPTWLRVGLWMVLGVAVYFLYGVGHSVLGGGRIEHLAEGTEALGGVELAPREDEEALQSKEQV